MPFSCFKKSVSVVEEADDGVRKSRKESDLNAFFVITTVFNPMSFNSRYELYHQFAKHMAETGAQLITVECIFPILNQTEFKVTSANNPFHIQLKSNSVYWMKENLINIAASRLPPHAKWICWLDADIYFEDYNWIQMAIDQLTWWYPVVQIFKKCKFLGPAPDHEVLRLDYSFGYSVVKGKPIDQSRYDEWYPHPGYGWAMSLPAFRLMNGLPEYDILGSADLHFAFSLINKVSNALENNLNPKFAKLILENTAETYRILGEFKRPGPPSLVGFVPVTIRHNWHGSRQDRQYVDRWKILIAHQFDFEQDMKRAKEGLLEFVDGRDALQRDILDHFRMRNEDETIIKSRTTEGDQRKKKHHNYTHFRSRSPPRDQYYDNEMAILLASTPILDDPDPPHEDPCHPCPAHPENEGYEPCPSDPVGHFEGQWSPAGGYAGNYDGTVTTSSYY